MVFHSFQWLLIPQICLVCCGICSLLQQQTWQLNYRSVWFMIVIVRDFMMPLSLFLQSNFWTKINKQVQHWKMRERIKHLMAGFACQLKLPCQYLISFSKYSKASFSNCATFFQFLQKCVMHMMLASHCPLPVYEPITPPSSGEVSCGRITGKGGHVALAAVQLVAL